MPRSRDLTRNDQLLFSESTSRFVVEIKPDNFGPFAQICKDIRFAEIGRVTESAQLVVTDSANKKLVDAPVSDLKEAWQAPLRW